MSLSYVRLVLAVGLVLCHVVHAEADDTRRLVVIHYANETSPCGADGANYESAIQRLRQVGTERALKIAGNLENDPVHFKQALETDRAPFRKAVQSGKLEFAFCEVDNESARRGKFRYWLPVMEQASTGSIQLPEFDNVILAGNPLATSEGLEATLKAIAETFPPDSHRYVLIALSHGSETMAMTVKLSRQIDLMTDDEFIGLVSSPGSSDGATALGTSKTAFFETIAKSGELDAMEFELVLLETCRGTMDEGLIEDMPANVKIFLGSGSRSLEFSSIPYAEILDKVTDERQLVPRLDDHLRSDFLRVAQVTPTRWVWLCFLPLGVLLLVGLFRRFTRRTALAAGRSDN